MRIHFRNNNDKSRCINSNTTTTASSCIRGCFYYGVLIATLLHVSRVVVVRDENEMIGLNLLVVDAFTMSPPSRYRTTTSHIATIQIHNRNTNSNNIQKVFKSFSSSNVPPSASSSSSLFFTKYTNTEAATVTQTTIQTMRPSMPASIGTNNPHPFSIHQRLLSVSSSQLQGGLFGLGIPELLIIAIGVGVVLGPTGIAKVVRAGTSRAVEIKDELTTVPKEFQKGYEIGDIEARSRKAKRIVVTKTNKDTEGKDSSS